MKKCNECKETKENEFFYKKLDKLSHFCKECTNRKNKEHYKKNKEKIKERGKKYYQKNKEKIKEYNKKWHQENWQEYYKKNKKKIRVKAKESYYKNHEKNKERTKKYYHDNKEEISKKNKEKYQKNKEKMRAQAKRRYYKNYEQTRKKANERQRRNIKRRLETDPFFKLKRDLRTMVSKSFYKKGWAKKSKSSKIIGCDYETAIEHLKNTFKNRYGINLEEAVEPIHIDHIIPLSTAKTEEDLIKLNHYTNLQYLYASDNLEKGDRLDWEKL